MWHRNIESFLGCFLLRRIQVLIPFVMGWGHSSVKQTSCHIPSLFLPRLQPKLQVSSWFVLAFKSKEPSTLIPAWSEVVRLTIHSYPVLTGYNKRNSEVCIARSQNWDKGKLNQVYFFCITLITKLLDIEWVPILYAALWRAILLLNEKKSSLM